ncbi:candidate carboxyvinyl-carboxyphosphonate phosphorylmutase [Corynebacterium suranareeae]|uniref:Candidate carboxyvinyl-carboxyphosphonate phosphorylmutase n=1 Tax=Corynebacterium suranareeae TaxID=2506452 RepID=A0A160PMJ7_9CORY|nr:isocitrate lyase/PEP mutase family protein [Corynebacterium suranareeae]BAU94425.1 candidate carboxyvinyl-carboxyphosphonate phosphorylmutase [Corynebacterium suranareeae]
MSLSKSARLRALFESKETTIMPFGTLPMHAQMAEKAGFPAFEVSGGMSSWWVGGVADVGWLTMTEVVAHCKTIAASVDIPIFCDADTGYGSAINARRTVQEFIQAGIAGIHIEDQLEPKKAGGQAGIALVSDEEAIGRINAACDARDEMDKDFVIVARTDGYGAEGGSLEEAIRRGKLYAEETGADCIFYEGLRTWEEVRIANEETPGPSYCIASRHAGPTPSVKELTEMGQAIQIAPFILPGVQEVWRLLLELKNTGELAPIDAYNAQAFDRLGEEDYVGFGDVFVKPSYEDVRKWEEAYYPAEKQRDYVNTIHD